MMKNIVKKFMTTLLLIITSPLFAGSPSVTLQTTTVNNPYPLTFMVNVAFSEQITGLSTVDINVTNGTVASISGNDCQSNYVLTIQPNAAGTMTISIPANAVVSVSTGQANLASNILNIKALIPVKPPASNFDLRNWGLTLPLPLGSLNNAISIGQVTLNGAPNFDNGYTKAPYFFTDPISGAMNFFAPLNGGTTPGSEFARCELYEILPGLSPYWKLNTFSSNTLSASLLVSAVPPGTKRMVIAQIHDKGNIDSLGQKASNSPLLKLYYDRDFVDPNDSVPCNGCVYAQIRTTPAQSNFLKIVRLINNIPLNTLFTYKITLLSNGTLTVTANNVTTTIPLNTSFNNTIGWGAQQLYFKAGVYNLEFGSSNTLGGAVSYYTLQVTHA